MELAWFKRMETVRSNAITSEFRRPTDSGPGKATTILRFAEQVVRMPSRSYAKLRLLGLLFYVLTPRVLYLARFLVYTRRLPSFSAPRRISDKLALRILSNHSTGRRRAMTDKLKCGAMVQSVCPELHIKKVYAAWRTPAEFSLAGLPQRFALKLNNASGMTILVLDKSKADEEKLRAVVAQWLRLDYYHITQEPSYRGIEAKVFAEELTVSPGDFFPFELRLFCFHGKVKFLECEFNPTELNGVFFADPHWNLLPVRYRGQAQPVLTARPAVLEQAIEIAEKLADGFDFIRVDMYDLPDGLTFSEMSSSPWGGLLDLEPSDADHLLGSFWEPFTVLEHDRD
jgi:hypothetical protein